MAESQEHADLVKSKKQLQELTEEHDRLKSTVAKLEATIRDQKEMMANFNNLIGHKNKAIGDLETAFRAAKGVPSGVAIAQSGGIAELASSRAAEASNYTHPEGFKQKLFKFLSKRVN
jgi:chromosome segregation ATPase